MTDTLLTKLKFSNLGTCDKALYESFFPDSCERGCEFSFANLCLWGKQQYAIYDGFFLLLSEYGKFRTYQYPIGVGNRKKAIEAIISDAKERNIECRISGLSEVSKNELETFFPERFYFSNFVDFSDYVYSIDDLADLPGKKYHNKRNHINRFLEAVPNYRCEVLDRNNILSVSQMAERWYELKASESPDGDFENERSALFKAFEVFDIIGMDGLVLFDDNNRVIAFTMGCRLCDMTFDVNFEKAYSDIQGAYTMINREFARYIRNKYPSVKYLDREEDMGIEGLRKAKLSYYPVKRVVKYRAVLREE